MKDLRAFGNLSVPEALLFEQYNEQIDYAYRRKSRRRDRCMNETLRMVGDGVDGLETDSRMPC